MNGSDRLEHLIGEHLDGVLDPHGEQELAERLDASADARKRLASHMRMHGAVCQLGKAGVLRDDRNEKGVRENKPAALPRIRAVAMLAGIAACLAVVVGYRLLSESAKPAPPILAEVVDARGATLRSGDQATDLYEGAPLYGGETICTTDGALIRFPDGTVVAMEERSDATFRLDARTKHVDLHDGSLQLDVARQPAGKPLIVRTPRASVIVLGTRLWIEASKDHTDVAINEGAVRLEAEAGQRDSVEVKTGEIAHVNERGMITKEAQFAYWDGSAKRVHVTGCKRLPRDPEELAKMTKMTLAEAGKKGLRLCSRCPGSTTPGTRRDVKDDEAGRPKSAD